MLALLLQRRGPGQFQPRRAQVQFPHRHEPNQFYRPEPLARRCGLVPGNIDADPGQFAYLRVDPRPNDLGDVAVHVRRHPLEGRVRGLG